MDAGVLYERYYDRVYGYCLYQLGTREEAEDAAQTTFMWAFRGLRRGVVPRAEANWLFTIAQNACRARHRARGRRREREVLSDPQVLEDLTASPVAENEELVGLEDALARMPELQRRAILLREWRGLSYREIASELGLSGPAVETLIFRARRSLAELLAGRPAPKRARRFAFEFGSLGAAVKALATGTAAKVAAGVAAAVVAVTIAGSTPQPAQTPQSRVVVVTEVKPAPRAAETPPRARTPARTRTRRPETVKTNTNERTNTDTNNASPSPTAPVSPPPTSVGGASTVGQTVDDAAASVPLVSDVSETLPVDSATDAVDAALDTVTGAMPAPVADALP